MSDLQLNIITPKVPDLEWAEERTRLAVAVKNRLAKYEGIKYTDETISQAKTDRAALNRFCKALDDRRKEIKAIYESPIKKFTAEVNEITNSIIKINDNIDAQIKDFEERKRAEKLEKIISVYSEIIGDLKDFVTYEKIADPRYLNATFALAAIREDLSKKIGQIRNELKTINALKSEDDATLKAFYFKTLNLSDALMENERLKEMRSKIQSAEPKKEEEKPKTIEDTYLTVKESDVCIGEKTYSLRFEVVDVTSEQLRILKDFFITNGIIYKKI